LSEQALFRNPKRRPLGPGMSWYDYYAGYSEEFVRDTFCFLDLPTGAHVLDPWNGTGITTQVAYDAGLAAAGYDINPAMVLVAKARLLDSTVADSLESLGRDIVRKAARATSADSSDHEPLDAWLSPGSARELRKIERAVQRLLIDHRHPCHLFARQSFSDVSSLAAFFYVALFRTLRELLASFRSSNPTWIRQPRVKASRLRPKAAKLRSLFLSHVKGMTEIVRRRPAVLYPSTGIPSPALDVASSVAIPLPDGSVEAVVTSPPYCTRIDYAVSTKPELALLGCNMRDEIRALRHRMIGTPTVVKATPEKSSDWGPTCSRFLSAVESHTSKASHTYYLKTYLQYFHMTYASLAEIKRTLATGGRCVLVVQDSLYKEVHNDLPRIYEEMGASLGWDLVLRRDFSVDRTMARINPQARRYADTRQSIESVLVFQN